MTKDRKEKILIAFAYNCVMAALAFGAFAFSLWLLISGRLAQEGVDAVFLFAVGLVLAGVFSAVPALSLRDGLLRDLRGVKGTRIVCRLSGDLAAGYVSHPRIE